MKVALEDYLGCDEGKGVKGMLMGTRKGDPNGGELAFELCYFGFRAGDAQRTSDGTCRPLGGRCDRSEDETAYTLHD